MRSNSAICMSVLVMVSTLIVPFDRSTANSSDNANSKGSFLAMEARLACVITPVVTSGGLDDVALAVGILPPKPCNKELTVC